VHCTPAAVLGGIVLKCTGWGEGAGMTPPKLGSTLDTSRASATLEGLGGSAAPLEVGEVLAAQSPKRPDTPSSES
jgi:hypothetical protein